jgi:hypothetical protein
MNDPRHPTKHRDAQQRAAEVRRRWSPSERLRRKGLPPDTPWSMLRQLLAPHCEVSQAGFDRPFLRWCCAPVSAS